MKCSHCKKETSELFTDDNFKMVCKKCLEKEIYKTRKKITKKHKKELR